MRGHGRLVDGDVRLLVEEVAQRVADRGGLEQVGRDLVQERLEGVVVVLVDEDDVDVGVLQLRAAPMPANPPPRMRTRGDVARRYRSQLRVSIPRTGMRITQSGRSAQSGKQAEFTPYEGCSPSLVMGVEWMLVRPADRQEGRQMTDPSAEFFEELQQRGARPLLQKMSGTLRFDVVDGKRSARWFVTIKKGDVKVSRQGSRPIAWSGVTRPLSTGS